MALALLATDPLEHVVQHTLVQKPADLGFLTPHKVVTVFSDQILTMIFAALLLIVFVPLFIKRRRGSDEVGSHVPAGPGNLIEAICEYLRKEVVEPNLHEHSDRFVKYIWTVFFFVLINNVMGLIPFTSVSKVFGLHFGGTPTGNVWVTGTLATMTFGMMVVNGLRLGGKEYLSHFSPGPLWLAPLLVPLEILGLFTRAFALAIRLFANMFAGHVLLAVLLSFILGAGSTKGAAAGIGVAIPVVLGSVAINLLEIFVAFLQAFIFTFLTALFIGQSVVFHHGSDHSDHSDPSSHRAEASAH